MATHDPTATDLDALLGGGSDWRRFLPWIGGIVLLIVAALTAYALTSGSDAVAVLEPEPAEATTGSITSTTSLSGTAAAAQSADLTFGSAGVVATVEVAVGDVVRAGDVLATLDDTEAARQVETAQISLDQAEASLAELLSDPATADVASAIATLRNAENQVSSADDNLSTVVGGATESELLSAQSSVANALSQLSTAEEALQALSSPADVAELASANSALTQAQAQLNSATIDVAATYDEVLDGQFAYCSWSDHITSLCSAGVLPLLEGDSSRIQTGLAEPNANSALIAGGEQFLDANVRYLSALAARDAGIAAVATAQERLAEIEGGPDAEAWFRANQALAAAQDNHDVAAARLADLQAPVAASDINQAQTSFASAQASLSSAQARYAELVGGADVTDIERQQQSVRLAEIGLERAQEGLEDVQVMARFDGVVGAVNVGVGDRVTANTVAVSVNTPDRITIDLTVSEAEVLDLEVGQVGIATFDAVGETQYPVRVTSVSTIPNVAQGVVTYAVTAVILELNEIAEVATDLQTLATGGATLDLAALAGGAGNGAARGDGAGRGAGGAAGGGAAAGLLGGLELPEGVTIQDVVAALVAGEELPAGVELADGFEIPAGLADRFAAGGAAPGGNGAASGSFADQNRQLPLAGMSGSVEILLGVRESVLLVPSSAVRAQGSTSYVVIQNDEGEFERLTVTTGESSGSNVEIVSGLESGVTIWINASAPASEDFSLQNVDVSQPQPDTAPQGPPPGGFGGGGGGGGRGGAQ